MKILDDVFTAAVQAKENAEKNLANAKALFESYLQNIFTNPGKDWEEKKLGEVAVVQTGGTPSRPVKEYWGGKIPWYSSGELNHMYTTDSNRKVTEAGISNSNARLFPKGSLLIGIYDTAALKMSILDRDATFNQAIAGIKPNDKLDLIFIRYAIDAIKPEILSLRRGTRQKNLSLAKIKDISLGIPSVKVQQSIVTKLDTLSAETKKLEAIYTQKLTALEELKKSVLKQAFEGRL